MGFEEFDLQKDPDQFVMSLNRKGLLVQIKDLIEKKLKGKDWGKYPSQATEIPITHFEDPFI